MGIYIPRSGNARSQVQSTFSLSRYDQTIFQTGFTNSHSHQQFIKVLVSVSSLILGITTFFKLPCVCAKLLHCGLLAMTLWTVARQAPLFMEFSRQEYWSGLPFPTQGDLPDPGREPVSPVLAGGFFTI